MGEQKKKDKIFIKMSAITLNCVIPLPFMSSRDYIILYR